MVSLNDRGVDWRISQSIFTPWLVKTVSNKGKEEHLERKRIIILTCILSEVSLHRNLIFSSSSSLSLSLSLPPNPFILCLYSSHKCSSDFLYVFLKFFAAYGPSPLRWTARKCGAGMMMDTRGCSFVEDEAERTRASEQKMYVVSGLGCSAWNMASPSWLENRYAGGRLLCVRTSRRTDK